MFVPRVKLLLTYENGIDPVLDEQIEKVVGKRRSSSGCTLFKPYFRDLEFGFSEVNVAQDAAVRVGELANKLARKIEFAIE